jgi:hypothetical protein
MKFKILFTYPGNLNRKEAIAVLGFDPGKPTNETQYKTMGTITEVDREKGIITISTKSTARKRRK